jgi:uncharacterized protein (TIGR02246 family)
MKVRRSVALLGLAISFALPTLAQHSNTPPVPGATAAAQREDTVDPQIDQQIRALTMRYEEALNEHDAKAAAAVFTEDAVWRTPQGTFYGRRAIERRLENYHFHRWHIKNEVITVDRLVAVGDEIRATGTWSNTVQVPDGSNQDFDGHFTSVLVLEGDTWKIRMNAYDQSRSY